MARMTNKHAIGERLFLEVPKPCFGRAYDSTVVECIDCPYREDCTHLFSLRAENGVDDPDDLRVPADYKLPEKYREEYRQRVLAQKPGGSQVESLPLTPWESWLPPQAEATTIPVKRLQEVEQLLRRRERKFCISIVAYMRDQGKLLREVWEGMTPVEFASWVSNRLDVGLSTVRRMIALAVRLEKLNNKALETALEEAPGLSRQKLDFLLGLDVDVTGLLTASTTDPVTGKKVRVTELPFPEMKKAVQTMLYRAEAAQKIDAALRADEHPSTVTVELDDKGRPVEQASSVQPTLPKEGEEAEEAPKPLNLLPFLIQQRSILRELNSSLDQWDEECRAKVRTRDLAVLTPRQCSVVESHIMTVRVLVDSLREYCDDLQDALKFLRGETNGSR